MGELLSNGLDVVVTICMGIGIITCTVVLVVFVGLLIFGMLDESGFIDFLRESRNNRSRT